MRGTVTIRLEQDPVFADHRTTVIAETNRTADGEVIELVRLSAPNRTLAAVRGDRRVADMVCRIASELLHVGFPHTGKFGYGQVMPDELADVHQRAGMHGTRADRIPSGDGVSPPEHR